MTDKLLAIGLRTPQEQIAALIRERDEALAQAEDDREALLTLIEHDAKARAKAIDEAAAVCFKLANTERDWRIGADECRRAILALKEKTR